MKLLEYKAKELFDKYGISTPNGIVVDSVEDMEQRIMDLNYPVVVKAQVQTGGRGKAGGIKFASNKEEALNIGKSLLGSTLKGFNVNQLLVAEKLQGLECYLSITLDRLNKKPIIIFSSMGGMEIEETAKIHPERIVKVIIDPFIGIKEYMVRYIINKSNVSMELFDAMFALIKNLYQLFVSYDCILAEINPLIITGEHKLIALDGKVDIDDSALYRHPDIMEFRKSLQEDRLILEARKFKFLYIPIQENGNIAVMSNGSGMIMSCIDLIYKKGMKVCAALDLGGGATSDRIAEAIRIVLSNKNVSSIFISIFGGITRCNEVALGIKNAMEAHPGEKMVVVRIEGTNKEEGLKILKTIKAHIVSVDSILEGVHELDEGGKCYEHIN